MKLTWAHVDAIIKAVLLTDDEAKAIGMDLPVVDLEATRKVLTDNGFDLIETAFQRLAVSRERLESKRAEITAMIGDLSEEFLLGAGGGMSMLNLPMTKNDEQWGEQWQADLFFGLAKGLGLADFCLKDRQAWAMMPGGMPYVWFKQ
jgi:hypothetical protein